jgi:hypothetical protein
MWAFVPDNENIFQRYWITSLRLVFKSPLLFSSINTPEVIRTRLGSFDACSMQSVWARYDYD